MFGNSVYPLVNSYSNDSISPLFIGNPSSIPGPFSIAMLDYMDCNLIFLAPWPICDSKCINFNFLCLDHLKPSPMRGSCSNPSATTTSPEPPVAPSFHFAPRAETTGRFFPFLPSVASVWENVVGSTKSHHSFFLLSQKLKKKSPSSGMDRVKIVACEIHDTHH